MNLRASADASRIRICQDVSDAEKSFEKAGAIRIAVKDGLSHNFHRSPSLKMSRFVDKTLNNLAGCFASTFNGN